MAQEIQFTYAILTPTLPMHSPITNLDFWCHSFQLTQALILTQMGLLPTVENHLRSTDQWCSQVRNDGRAQHGHIAFLKIMGYCVKRRST